MKKGKPNKPARKGTGVSDLDRLKREIRKEIGKKSEEESSSERKESKSSDRKGSESRRSDSKSFDSRKPKSRDHGKKKSYSAPTSKQGKSKHKESTRLNKFIANSGICSRREADKLIESGVISVNGKVVTEMGVQIFPGDTVKYGDQTLSGEDYVYILMNKPKDYITTVRDERGRNTVMHLLGRKVKERVYPVGRLDRNTTGLLLLTNDGNLADKLTHPRNKITKLYTVHTDQNVKPSDLDKLVEGVTLEDGDVKADEVSFVKGDRSTIGVSIHSGKNRVIRRMFEELGYKVTKLDRVMFAGLTKKDLPRGHWRYLTDKELAYLKML